MFEVRWHGRGGQGSFTGARLLGVAASLYDHKYAQAFPSFGPERRGAPVLGFNRLSKDQITDRSEIIKCDRMVFLDETLWDNRYLNELKEGGLILINTDKTFDHPAIKTMDATKLSLEVIERPIANTAMLGFLIAHSEGEITLDACISAIGAEMKPALAAKNADLLKIAHSQGKEASQ